MERSKPNKRQPMKNETMSSNLPLLFANSRPTTLEKMSEAQLDKFVSFMTQCSFIQEDAAWTKDVFVASRPKWWPHEIPFKFPLDSGYPNSFVSRKVMLKTLVCCCYTFYNSEFLLKFSSELAEMEPGSLCYVPSVTGNITLIYTIQGALLVKCKNENLNYDDVKCTDAYHNKSENDDEVHFKQCNGIKRKFPFKNINHNNKQLCYGKENEIPVIDLTDETPEEQDQATYLKMFGLVPTKDANKYRENLGVNKKAMKAARRTCTIPFSCKSGQDVYLNKNKQEGQASNTYHFDRVSRYCNTTDLSKMQPVMQEADSADESDTCDKWTHIYKPARRSRKPKILHRGQIREENSVRRHRRSPKQRRR